MNMVVETKKERLSLRVPPSQKAKIERAANLKGKSVNNFVLDSATLLAEEVISSNEIKFLSGQNALNFIKALEKSAEFNEELKAAFTRYENRVISK